MKTEVGYVNSIQATRATFSEMYGKIFFLFAIVCHSCDYVYRYTIRGLVFTQLPAYL